MNEGRDTADDSWRDDPEWHHDRFPAGDSDESALRTARTEARESLVETIRSIRRVEESAMKTLRIDLLLVGLSLTAVSSFRPTAGFVNGLTIVGFVVVGLSALVAVVPTLSSEYPTGVSEAYVEEFQQASWSEREWNAWMLREYSGWLSDANEMAAGGARLLFYAQVLLGFGLLSLILGAALGVSGVPDATIELGATFDAALGLTDFKYFRR